MEHIRVLGTKTFAIATIADGGLAALLLWGARGVSVAISTGTILFVAVAVMLVEGLFFHPYLHRVTSLTSLGPLTGRDDKQARVSEMSNGHLRLRPGRDPRLCPTRTPDSSSHVLQVKTEERRFASSRGLLASSGETP